MPKITSLNLENRVYSSLPSGWSEMKKRGGYAALSAASIAGSATPYQVAQIAVPTTLAAVAADCGGQTPTSPTPIDPIPLPKPTYLQGQVPLEGLLYQTKGSGQVVIPGKKPIAYENGIMTFDESNELLPGIYRDVEVIPSDSRGVRRKTPVEIDRDGRFWVDIGYKKVPLDYIDDSGIAAKWAATRWDQIGLKRVNSQIGKMRVFFYDNSRWRGDSSGIVKTQDNVPAPKDIIDKVTSVVNNDLSIYTNGAIPNGGLIRESQSSLRPNLNESGWLIYLVGENKDGWAISAGDNGWGNRGDITFT